MSQKTLTRAEISDSIADEVGVSRQKAVELLECVLEEMSSSLIEHGTLKLSSFGSFSVRQKNDRIGRNPKTGKEVTIQPRKAISFKASHLLKERVIKAI
tara:strand:+ start:2188 stop:2484 length:297 start_codon:yes stop_codon:yes gene_type:complete